MNTIALKLVYYMPKILEPGILYFSQEFNIAGHMCPCGCGNKVITPIGPTYWSIKIKRGKPSLYPSIGNWQIPCKSHYWIKNGEIEWSYEWNEKQILEGRQSEERRRKSYHKKLERKKAALALRFLKSLFAKSKKNN